MAKALLLVPLLLLLRGDAVTELLLPPTLVFLRGDSAMEPVPVYLFPVFLALGLGLEWLVLHLHFILRLGTALGHLNL